MLQHHTGEPVIARAGAQAVLEDAYASPRPALVSVVGKTFLVRETFSLRLAFAITGIAKASRATQLANFVLQLQRTFAPAATPETFASWLEGFAALGHHTDASSSSTNYPGSPRRARAS